jgi:beta-alanine--pyruvate transaminase
MGAVFVSDAVHDAFMQGPESAIDLFHGYTYSGHPLACAAGLAALDTYEEEGLFEQAKVLAPVWEDALHSLRGLPNVIDIRNYGLVGAVELAPRDGAPATRGFDVFARCFQDHDLMVRVTGDVIAMSPPLIVQESHIAQIVERLGKAIKATA